jgi:hypothetical protein
MPARMMSNRAAVSVTKRFRSTVEGSEKGRAYVALPFDPASLWGTRARYYVNGTINDMPMRAVVEKWSSGHAFSLGPAWRRDCGVRVGDSVEVALSIEGPQRDGLAPDLAAALEAEPEAAQFWDALASFYRKSYLRFIDATKRSPQLRAARIAETVELLKAGRKQRPG